LELLIIFGIFLFAGGGGLSFLQCFLSDTSRGIDHLIFYCADHFSFSDTLVALGTVMLLIIKMGDAEGDESAEPEKEDAEDDGDEERQLAEGSLHRCDPRVPAIVTSYQD